MRRRQTSILVAVALIVAVALSAAAGAAGAGGTSPWRVLGEGRQGSFGWSARVRQAPAEAAGREGARRLCLLVGSSWRFGRFSYRRSRYRDCTEPGERLAASGVPLVANSLQNGGRDGGELSAVGMVFAPAARRVRLTFADSSEATLALRRGRVAGRRRFRYATFLVHGVWCAERVVSEAASGRALWDSGVDQYRCLDTPRLVGETR